MTDAQLDALVLQGLASGTTYGVGVKAKNQDGDETSLSAEGQGTTLSTPANLTQNHYRCRNDDGYETPVRIGTVRSATVSGTNTLDITNVGISGSNRYLLVGICYNNNLLQTTSSVVLDPGGFPQMLLQLAPIARRQRHM